MTRRLCRGTMQNHSKRKGTWQPSQAHRVCAFSIETPHLYACMRPTGDARLPSTYCPTCQRLCSQQDSRLAPTKSHCWASHRAKLRAGSHWQLWPVKPANVLFLSFQSASRILCIYLLLTNCVQPAQKAGFMVLSAWLQWQGQALMGSRLSRSWGSRKMQPKNKPTLQWHHVALICLSEVLGSSSAVAARNSKSAACPDGYLLLRRIVQSTLSVRGESRIENPGFRVR